MDPGFTTRINSSTFSTFSERTGWLDPLIERMNDGRKKSPVKKCSLDGNWAKAVSERCMNMAMIRSSRCFVIRTTSRASNFIQELGVMTKMNGART